MGTRVLLTLVKQLGKGGEKRKDDTNRALEMEAEMQEFVNEMDVDSSVVGKKKKKKKKNKKKKEEKDRTYTEDIPSFLHQVLFSANDMIRQERNTSDAPEAMVGDLPVVPEDLALRRTLTPIGILDLVAEEIQRQEM